MTITNEIILDSIGEHSPRLVTMRCRYPKFVHAEHLRHRSFSFSVSSSRAIPVSKNLEEVRSDELRAAPVWWGKEQKGMQSGEELSEDRTPEIYNPFFYRTGQTEKEAAQKLWATAAYHASRYAELLRDTGAHKSIVNRLLEPFLNVNVLVTGTEPGWMNFFGLRLDRAAQPEIRTLAELQWKHWNENKPQLLQSGEWHLPFIDEETVDYVYKQTMNQIGIPKASWAQKIAIKISVARCARLSYMSFGTNRRSTIDEDLELYDRLVGSSPIHASPAEHQATPDYYEFHADLGNIWKYGPNMNGNLGSGWCQYRKMLPSESLAQLPKEYQHG